MKRDDVHQIARVAHDLQTEIDDILEPPTVPARRRSPRKRSGGPVIKIRLTAGCEDDAQRACELVEELLTALNCRMQRPRTGNNPKYADDPKWLAYGDFELPAKKQRKRR